MTSIGIHQKSPEMPIPPPDRPRLGASLAADVDAFLDYKRISRGRSARTVEVYRLALRRLGEFLAGRPHTGATPDELVLFSGKWLYDMGLTDPVTRKTHVSAVREFYRFLHARGATDKNLAAQVEHAKAGRRIPKVINLDHAERLMWAPDYDTFEGVRDAAIIAVLIGCGLRVGGLIRLNVSNIESAVINRAPRLLIRTIEKGNRERMLPIPQQADLLLRLYLEHPDLSKIDRGLPDGDKVLFVSTRNRIVPAHKYIGEARRLGKKGVQRMIRKYARQVGVPEDLAHPHAMRHLFGTELAEDDVPTTTASLLLGHEDPKNTKIYQHTAMRKLAQVIDTANPLTKMRTPVSNLLRTIGKR